MGEKLDDEALDVPSPTFTLAQGYDGGPFPILHADLYRINQDSDYDDWVARADPTLAAELRWPLARHSGGVTHVIEPVAQLVWSPERTREELKVIIKSARPGLVIGPKGAEIERMTKELDEARAQGAFNPNTVMAGATETPRAWLDVLGERIAKRYKLICFDEFHVADITDAMILHRLLVALFDKSSV